MPRRISEEATRKDLIDRKIEKVDIYFYIKFRFIKLEVIISALLLPQAASGEELCLFFGRTLMPSILDKAVKGVL